MVKLKADFEADWYDYVRTYLVQDQGWSVAEISSLADQELGAYYFDSKRRRISQKPRTLKIADNFICPPANGEGWNILERKIQDGEDLNPYLSERHASLSNRDGLLADWDVHHFHLGVGPYPKNPAYMDRTGPLLYARIDEDAFYAIDVYDHCSFEMVSIVESVHRNWPDTIKEYRIHGLSGEALEKNERRALRRKMANAALTTADGTTYLPISGGVTTSGVAATSVIQSDNEHKKIRELQRRTEKNPEQILPLLRAHGYSNEDVIDAKLVIKDSGYVVSFPKYNLSLEVSFDTSLGRGSIER